MVFRDRADAATQLAHALKQWQGKNPLVLAIPRGAVPMAKFIADALGGELDVVLIRKLPAPGSPEFAIGAVDETGWSYIADYAAQAGATPDYIARATAAEMATMRRRRAQYTPVRPPLDPAGRVSDRRRRRARDRRDDDRRAARGARARAATPDLRGAGRVDRGGRKGAPARRRRRVSADARVLSRRRAVLPGLSPGRRRRGDRAPPCGGIGKARRHVAPPQPVARGDSASQRRNQADAASAACSSVPGSSNRHGDPEPAICAAVVRVPALV